MSQKFRLKDNRKHSFCSFLVSNKPLKSLKLLRALVAENGFGKVFAESLLSISVNE